MPSDAVTFFASFAAVFAGIALYLLRLERLAKRLEERLASLESLTAKPKGGDSPAGPKA